MDINILAVILSAVSTFLIGGIWYGPLFYKQWMKENNFTEEGLKKRNMGMVFGGSLIIAIISATLLEMFIGKNAELGFALFASISVGLAWVAGSMGVTYLFEGKSFKLFLINAGYHVVSFLVMGIILGLMK
jgi:hypothetical protein